MKNWTMDLLKYRPFPELATAVRERKAVVMERWLVAVRETLPAAHELTLVEVRNQLPVTLDLMADALEADDPRPTKELMSQSTSHGEARFDQNYNLSELMIEYGLLRPILIEETALHLGRVISVEEIQALNLAIDISTRRGVITYVNQQKLELQSLVEAQAKYLGFLSHDLRGGLNGVLLMIEVLRKDLSAEPKFAESIKDIEMMRRSILDTVSTMDRFLHAERFRRGKVQIKPSEVDLGMLLGDIAGQFSYHAKEKDLELSVAGDGAITSDRELLSIILQNLVGNAVKYSKRGEIKLDAARDLAQCATRISVQDNGPGIAPEKIEELFKPFSRGETHGQSGTGLGLSIARQAAELIGAKLWAESTLGHGSTFHLDLPAQPPASSPTA
jgi:signal transduction histidine kinase